MFKSLFCLLMLMSSVCFSYFPEVDTNLNKAWEMSRKNEWRQSLDFLTSLVDNPEISNVDRVHYLWRRAHVHAVFHNIPAYSNDMGAIHLLMEDYPECAKEAQEFYQVMK
jgi:hypothetical protein